MSIRFDANTRAKIARLRALYIGGTDPQVYELLKVEWGSDPADAVYYATLRIDEITYPQPPVSPIEVRLIPDGIPHWFLPITIGASVSDEEIDFKLSDTDGRIGTLLDFHGEGCKVILYQWFPQVDLLLPMWPGHLRFEDEAEFGETPLKAAQGFRSADSLLPRRGRYPECQAVFGALLETQPEIDANPCDYSLHIGGPVGIVNPATGVPWTFCRRKITQDCIDRGVNPLRHYSHQTIRATVINNQTSGGPLYSTSVGNETNLKEPVRVVMGQRMVYGMKVLAFRRDLNNNHPDQGFFAAIYEGPEGPNEAFANAVIGGQPAIGLHYNQRLGHFGQTPVGADLTVHGYSGTSLIRYNLQSNPSSISPDSITAQALVTGQNNIRIYTDATTYSTGWTRNRVWQLLHVMTNKQWGFGYDYDHFAIESWIEAAEWAAENVRFTDSDGTNWDHTRAASDVDLPGKKVQEQIDAFCKAGQLSRPFMFDGKWHIVPLRALTQAELDACPTFTDTGDSGRNILWNWKGDKSTLRYSRKSGIDLPNRIEATYDDATNGYLEATAPPVEDVDAQLAAGAVQGKKDRRVNRKSHSLMGVTSKAQAVKLSFLLLDRGEFDDGGLQNNLRVKFQIFGLDALDLHPHKVIQFPADHWLVVRFGFTHFRILAEGLKRQSNLAVEVEAQAYPREYMDNFETVIVTTPPGLCSIGADCDPGFRCLNGVCVPIIDPPTCLPTFGAGVALVNNRFTVPIEPC